MPRTLFALVLALAGTAEAASFSLVPTSSLFIGQGEFASFDVIYTAEEGDAPVLAANLRVTYEHDRRAFTGKENVVLVGGTAQGSAFEIPTLNLDCPGPFACPNHQDIGGAQRTLPPLDASEGLKLGELSFGVEGPMMGNAGVITLTSTFPQTGSRDADFGIIPDTTPEVLAVIYVPEASAMLLLLPGLLGLSRMAWR